MKNKINLDNINIEKFAYLAGCIDCDGCIRIRKIIYKNKIKSYSLSIRVAQKDKRIINFCQKTFGGNIYSNGKNSGTFWEWGLLGSFAKDILEKIEPFLIYKKDQARIGIEYEKMRQEQTKKYQIDRVRHDGTKGSIKGLLSNDILQTREKYYQKLRKLKKEIE